MKIDPMKVIILNIQHLEIVEQELKFLVHHLNDIQLLNDEQKIERLNLLKL
jgi:hypothetical protein